MPQKPGFSQRPLNSKRFLGLLASVYLVYLAALVYFLVPSASAPSSTITEHVVDTSPSIVLQHWTTASMQRATDADVLIDNPTTVSVGSATQTQVQAVQQPGQPPQNGDTSYPLTTVGKVFFTNGGQDYVCSGTAVTSANKNTVDMAGHCLYWNGSWVQNMIFCPQYDRGSTPYGCWAARDLEVPSDWIEASPNDLHHDFGMAIVAPTKGNLTDLVGGAGWAYNQSVNRTFSAYGYPAAYPFDGQTRQSCENAQGKSWQLAGGKVVSILCDMTGGSSGGPWFIQINGNWYLDGHNDFTSSAVPDHMFSPYYDETWYALYTKAQNS